MAKHLMVATFVSIAIAASAAAQTGPALLFKPWTDAEHRVETDVDAFFFAQGDTDGPGPDRFQIQLYESQGRLRLGGADATNPVHLGYDLFYLNIDSNDPALPERLVDLEVAVGGHLFDCGDWAVDFVAGAGYAGNNPFADDDALYGRGDVVFSKQLDEKSQLQLALSYDGNRSIFPDVPLPWIAYSRRSSETLSYTVGLPYNNITWEPIDRWTLSLDYWVPFTINATVTFELHEKVDLFGGFRNRFEAFHLDGDNEHRRLFFSQKRLEAGATWRPCANGEVTVAAGYAFDQEFERGFDARDTTNIRDVSDEPFVRAAIEFRF